MSKLSRFQLLKAFVRRPLTSLDYFSNLQVLDKDLELVARQNELRAWIENQDLIREALDKKKLTDLKMAAFLDELNEFSALSADMGARFTVSLDDVHPCLDDKSEETFFDRHYTYHPAWAARIIAKINPRKHIDISSIIHFSTILSAFVSTELYDFRPVPLSLDNLTSGREDLTQLSFADGSVESLSCMHVIEHVGLGRYGEPLDPDGDIKAINELVRVLAPGGALLVAVPVGEPRICFNAHRVYDYEKFAAYFEGLVLKQFALIPDGRAPQGLIFNPTSDMVRAQSYACGCYWFERPLNNGGLSSEARGLPVR